MQGLTRSTVLSLAVVMMDDGEIRLPALSTSGDIHYCFTLLITGVRGGEKLSGVMGVYTLVTPMRVSWWRREAGGEAAGGRAG